MAQLLPGDPLARYIMGGTLVFSLALFVFSLGLLRSSSNLRQNLGASLLSGSVVTVAVFLLQVMLTANTEHTQREDQKQRDKQQHTEQQQRDEENFRLIVAVSGYLRGFNPGKHSVAGLYLSGKDLTGANFNDVHLEETQFQDAVLARADLRRAHARNANFLNADFFKASVDDADFRGADLRFAKFEGASVAARVKFAGAKVNSETCWPKYFLDNLSSTVGLVPDKNPIDPSNQYGHVCTDGEHKRAGPA